MQRARLIEQLAQQSDVLRAILTGMTAEEYQWKPAPEKWCALEVTCHLHDEEREDFRTRLKQVLERPDLPFPKIDPVAWVGERKYMEQDFNEMLLAFLRERALSVEWLRGLADAPWSNVYMHPTVGPVSCGLLLTNWVAHDLHHIRQLNNLRYGYLATISTVPLDYAGKW
ncbi:MAG: DinB family protein [Flavobacteriales bacterium]